MEKINKKWFLDIIARLWFVYTIFLFIVSATVVALPCTIFSWFCKDQYKRGLFAYYLFTGWIKVYLILVLVRLRLNNYHLINQHKDEAFIFIANHRSFFDILVLTPFLPKPNLTIGKDIFAKIPFFASIYKMGAILVDRKDSQSRLKSYQKLLSALENHFSVCIYSEGTRNKKQGILLPFQNGAFKLSFQSGKKVVIVVLKNMDAILPSHRYFYMLPGTCYVNILEIVDPKNFNTEQELKQYCFEKMSAWIKDNIS